MTIQLNLPVAFHQSAYLVGRQRRSFRFVLIQDPKEKHSANADLYLLHSSGSLNFPKYQKWILSLKTSWINKNYYVVRNARSARSRYTLNLQSLIFLINE